MSIWNEMNWFAIHAKAGQEPVAQLQIESLDLEVFLPRIQEERMFRGVHQRVTKPLFPGYLFARFFPAKFLHLVRYSRGVLRVVGGVDTPTPVQEEIIAAIQERIGADGFVELEEREQWVPGDRLVIQEGPLRGLTGIFQRNFGDARRVVLLLEALNQAQVLVERWSLEPA